MPTVAVLLATYNGQAFLPEMLRSLEQQTHRDWVLYWRDDGSGDRTAATMEDFIARIGPARARQVRDPGRLGATESFFRLLRAAAAEGQELLSFADQDDVLLPEKLARGVGALRDVGGPALYFARQWQVDPALRKLGVSPLRRPAFPAALTQNAVTGCTAMLNRPAALLVARSRPPANSYHDWWCYLLLSAAHARLISDDAPVILYRQHPMNAVGAPRSKLRRGVAALRRGRSAFIDLLREHL
ncbi:MAG: glycosyltransferase, partial [Acetobacteraceae bacterium]